MRLRTERARGFTLIELMVTISVLAILMVAAVPSFVDFRERAAVRGAAEQLVSFWANAKMEALKRDRPISISLKTSGTAICMGASTVLAGCDCFAAAACDVGQHPAELAAQSDLRGITPIGVPTLGTGGVAVIDPKRGHLANAGDTGGISIQSPGSKAYRLRLYVDRWARPSLCMPTDSPRSLSDYSTRSCAP